PPARRARRGGGGVGPRRPPGVGRAAPGRGQDRGGPRSGAAAGAADRGVRAEHGDPGPVARGVVAVHPRPAARLGRPRARRRDDRAHLPVARDVRPGRGGRPGRARAGPAHPPAALLRSRARGRAGQAARHAGARRVPPPARRVGRAARGGARGVARGTVIGLTATPPEALTRDERVLVDRLFGRMVTGPSIPAMVRDGELVPFAELAWFAMPTGRERAWLAAQAERFAELTADLVDP